MAADQMDVDVQGFTKVDGQLTSVHWFDHTNFSSAYNSHRSLLHLTHCKHCLRVSKRSPLIYPWKLTPTQRMAAQPFSTQQLHGHVHRVAFGIPSHKPSRFLPRQHVPVQQHMLHAAKVEEAASAQVCRVIDIVIHNLDTNCFVGT